MGNLEGNVESFIGPALVRSSTEVIGPVLLPLELGLEDNDTIQVYTGVLEIPRVYCPEL
jgi:hypothetical protein